jgi:uncharacterized PurR-regulated membrane protein YhhQ (DUF165 family)
MNFYTLKRALVAMIFVVLASNYLVMFPVNDWLTWGAFTYPISYLVTEVTNRLSGPQMARRIVYAGFLLGVFLSFWLATPKIAIASGLAFLVSQLLDIFIFNGVRNGPWWYAPFIASFFASTIDTAIFWNIAFYGEKVPLLTWAIGDFIVKLFIDFAMLTPFRLMTRRALLN